MLDLVAVAIAGVAECLLATVCVVLVQAQRLFGVADLVDVESGVALRFCYRAVFLLVCAGVLSDERAEGADVDVFCSPATGAAPSALRRYLGPLGALAW